MNNNVDDPYEPDSEGYIVGLECLDDDEMSKLLDDLVDGDDDEQEQSDLDETDSVVFMDVSSSTGGVVNTSSSQNSVIS